MLDSVADNKLQSGGRVSNPKVPTQPVLLLTCISTSILRSQEINVTEAAENRIHVLHLICLGLSFVWCWVFLLKICSARQR